MKNMVVIIVFNGTDKNGVKHTFVEESDMPCEYLAFDLYEEEQSINDPKEAVKLIWSRIPVNQKKLYMVYLRLAPRYQCIIQKDSEINGTVLIIGYTRGQTARPIYMIIRDGTWYEETL